LDGEAGVPDWLHFSGDGKRLATVGAETVFVWGVDSGRKVCSCQMAGAHCPNVAFSATGRLVAASGRNLEKAGKPGEIKVWEVDSGKELLTINRHSEGISSLAFRPDGKVLASGADDRSVRLLDLATGKQLHRLEGPDGSITDVAFSRDGRLLAVAGWHTGVRLFDGRTAKKLRVLACDHVCYALAFSPDGKLLAASDVETDTVRVWDTGSGKLRTEAFKKMSPRPRGWQSAFSADGRRLVSFNREQTLLWEATTGKVLWCWKHPPVIQDGTDYWKEVVSPDGCWDAVVPEKGGDPCKIKLWRLLPAKGPKKQP
jgi:WD40 repeat protein